MTLSIVFSCKSCRVAGISAVVHLVTPIGFHHLGSIFRPPLTWLSLDLRNRISVVVLVVLVLVVVVVLVLVAIALQFILVVVFSLFFCFFFLVFLL